MKNQKQEEVELLTPEEVKEYLNVGETTLRKIDRIIRPYIVGNRRRYTHEMLDEYLEGSKKRE